MTSSIEVPPESTITSTSVPITLDTEQPPQSAPVTSTPNTVVSSIASTTTVVMQTESPSAPMQLSIIPKTATPTATPDKSKISLVITENGVKITLVETNVGSEETATPTATPPKQKSKIPLVVTKNSVKITLVEYNKTNVSAFSIYATFIYSLFLSV